jgi:hypothetical protein
MFCSCHDRLPLKEAARCIIDEVLEFIEQPCRDELSDVVYTVNRFIGSMVGKDVVRLVPGDAMHLAKVRLRMDEYGCIRSKRHLVSDRCPGFSI